MHAENGVQGRYYVVHASGESELTYAVASPTLVIAEHTQVASGHEGEGLGLMLVRELVADARNRGFVVSPLCPFVNAQRRKHPEWADVFSG